MEIALAVGIIGVCVLMAVWASIKVLADEFSDRWQKGAQLALVWLVPVIGPLVVFGVHRSAEKASGRYCRYADPAWDQSAIGPAIRRTVEALDDD